MPLSPWIIVPAAGSGRRMAEVKPKQYLTINGQTIIALTLSRLVDVFPDSKCVVAVANNDPFWPSVQTQFPHVVACEGGESRGASVWQALLAAKENGAKEQDWILVHDAVRPCVPTEDLHQLWQSACEKKQSSVLGVPVVDSLRLVDQDGAIVGSVSRDNLWRVFTPQLYPFQVLFQALSDPKVRLACTDESQAVIDSGYNVVMVAGSDKNIKITYPNDLEAAKIILHTQVIN